MKGTHNNHTIAPAITTGANPTVDMIVPPVKYNTPANIAFLPMLEFTAYNATEPVVLAIFNVNDDDSDVTFDTVVSMSKLMSEGNSVIILISVVLETAGNPILIVLSIIVPVPMTPRGCLGCNPISVFTTLGSVVGIVKVISFCSN